MQTRVYLNKKEREELRSFGEGMSRMANIDGGNRKHGARIVKALEIAEYLETRVKVLEKDIKKAGDILCKWQHLEDKNDEL